MEQSGSNSTAISPGVVLQPAQQKHVSAAVPSPKLTLTKPNRQRMRKQLYNPPTARLILNPFGINRKWSERGWMHYQATFKRFEKKGEICPDFYKADFKESWNRNAWYCYYPNGIPPLDSSDMIWDFIGMIPAKSSRYWEKFRKRFTFPHGVKMDGE
jgi:hypothetical protein